MNKAKTYKVEFTTFFPRSPYISIVLEAASDSEAQRVARNFCRFGYISDCNETDEKAAFTVASHAYAYDEDYEIYS